MIGKLISQIVAEIGMVGEKTRWKKKCKKVGKEWEGKRWSGAGTKGVGEKVRNDNGMEVGGKREKRKSEIGN